MIDIRKMQQENERWARENFTDTYHLKHNPVLGICEEAGELCHAFLKSEQGIRINENHSEDMVDAIGDIFVYMMDFCNRNKIDLESTMQIVWDKVKQRNWKENKETGT